MQRAIELARKGWGTTHPNPMVGAVIVERSKIVGEGYHAQAGSDHAEIVALKSVNKSLSREATLYVNLEPCSTQGRMPPCTKAIIDAGIGRVVIGMVDPNPSHQGKGLRILRAAGVEVDVGVLKFECEDLNLIFNHWITRGTPYFAGKLATTLDGRIATRTGHSRWITGENARKDVMQWRRLFPAIAVGSETVLKDDPRLTSRRKEGEWSPLRFIFDRRLRTFRDPLPKVYTDSHRERTTIVTRGEGDDTARRRLQEVGIEEWIVGEEGQSSWASNFRRRCREKEIVGVLFEGGSRLISSLLLDRELDYLFCYRSPTILADECSSPAFLGASPMTIGEGSRLEQIRHSVFDDDELMRGKLVYPNA